MKNAMKVLTAATLLASSKAALAAAMCSTLIAPSVQVTLEGDKGDHVVTPVVAKAGIDQDVGLENDGEFWLSNVLPAGDYTLKLVEGDNVLYSQDFKLVKSNACYIVPFVATYTCEATLDDQSAVQGQAAFTCGPKQ